MVSRASEFLKKFNEEWVTTLKSTYDKAVEYKVYINPTASELAEISTDTGSDLVRFVVSMTENKVYVFSYRVLHSAVIGNRSISIFPSPYQIPLI